MFRKAKSMMLSGMVSVIALVAVSGGLGSRCLFIIHEPEVPEALKNMVRS